MTAAQSSMEDPHLLVVDDDERLRTLLTRYLTANGYRVTAAADAADARALMKSFAFDLLVLDVMMPGRERLCLDQGGAAIEPGADPNPDGARRGGRPHRRPGG